VEIAMSESEVAQLRRQITLEYEAMVRGLTGFAEGAARHAVIKARMRCMDTYYKKLVQQIGEEKALLTVCELYDRLGR
jgi:hypothetical protein